MTNWLSPNPFQNPKRAQLAWQPVRNVHARIHGGPEYVWMLMRDAPEYRSPSPMPLEIHVEGEYPYVLSFVDPTKSVGESGRRRFVSRHQTLEAAQQAGEFYAKQHSVPDAAQSRKIR